MDGKGESKKGNKKQPPPRFHLFLLV